MEKRITIRRNGGRISAMRGELILMPRSFALLGVRKIMERLTTCGPK